MKKILLLTTFILVSLIGTYIYFSKPYIKLIEVRTKTQPVTLLVEYVNVTDDANCTRLYQKTNDQVDYSRPVYPAFAGNMPSPDDGPHAYDENRFKLTGFSYQYEKHNLITGSVEIFPSYRIDVIAWEVIPPYMVWTEKTDVNDMVIAEPSETPLFYSIDPDQYPADSFHISNYINCMN